MDVPRLETARLELTLPPPDAAPRLAAYASRNAGRLRPSSPAFPAGFFEEDYWRRRLIGDLADFDADRSMRLVAFERGRPHGNVVALCSFTQVARGPLQRCVLGYSIDGAFEGRGLMVEGLRAAIAFVFGPLGFHRIEANHRPDNERSARVLKRLGFVVEGFAKDYLLLDGGWCDHVLTSLTNPAPGRVRRPEQRGAENAD